MAATHADRPDASGEQNSFAREAICAGYAIATFAASVATFGEAGIVIGLFVTAFWACVFAVPSCWLRVMLMISLACIGLFLLLPPLDSGPGFREATWRMSCSNNLKRLALAVHNYYDVYKSFPPAYVKDEDGRRLHSWRALILPYLEDQQHVHDAYNFAEPWDSPNNRKLIPQMPKVFCCPSQCKYGDEPTGFTNYFAVVGENTAWPAEPPIGFKDITDGCSNTLLLLEVADRAIPWTEPTDIERGDALKIFMSSEFAVHRLARFSGDQSGGALIALVDGSVQFVPRQADQSASKLLITRNDGERFNVDALHANAAPLDRPPIGNRIRLGVFVLLALCPLPWVWVNPRRTPPAIQAEETSAADDA